MHAYKTYVYCEYNIGVPVYTVYGKTFEGENFRGFLANHESFPLESLAVYST